MLVFILPLNNTLQSYTKFVRWLMITAYEPMSEAPILHDLKVQCKEIKNIFQTYCKINNIKIIIHLTEMWLKADKASKRTLELKQKFKATQYITSIVV